MCIKKIISRKIISCLTVLILSGCGGTAFNPSTLAGSQPAPGTYMIPPQVDILMAEDDTGAMFEPYSSIHSNVQSFLNDLDTEGWDYHFAVIPLTTYRPLQQVVGSVYDGNNTAWQPPYPGVIQFGPTTILSSLFRSASTFNAFITNADISNTLNQGEPGLANGLTTYTKGFGTSNFSRKGVLQVFFVVGNGEDTSDENMCVMADNSIRSCGVAGKTTCIATATDPTGGNSQCNSDATSLAYYQKQYPLAVGNLFQFHAAVAASAGSQCKLNGSARIGARYQQMAASLNGKSYDICTSTFGQVLTSLSSNLTATSQNYMQQRIFLAQAPNPSSIAVTRYVGGNTSNAVLLASDSKNGWTYEGYVQNAYAKYSLTPTGQIVNLSPASGYSILLHGSAVLHGSDTANATFTPVGATSAVAN